MSLNAKYLKQLSERPLLTKSLTAAVLAVLNETIASIIAKDFKITQVLNLRVKHPFSAKVLLLALYGFFVSSPITHYGFMYLNKLFKPPLTPKKRILQILTSLATITPLMSAFVVSFVSLINLKPPLQSVSKIELERVRSAIRNAFKSSYFAVVKSSWITSPLTLLFAQRYIDPELWAVFNNAVFFVLGTAQNTLLKLRVKHEQNSQKKKMDGPQEHKEEALPKTDSAGSQK